MLNNFSIADCIAMQEFFSQEHIPSRPEVFPPMSYIVIDLQKFDQELRRSGVEKIITQFLQPPEQGYWNKLTAAKRKREWLGGRLAVKYAAARLLSSLNSPEDSWPELIIAYDANGRPYLIPAGQKIPLPDISISHSADLAAAMAVSRGLCGIDIQKISPRVGRVRKRFCIEAEIRILASFFSQLPPGSPVPLTKLWAAKEALRKTGKHSPVSGFLELELVKITTLSSAHDLMHWEFIVKRKPNLGEEETPHELQTVMLGQISDYILALTATDANISSLNKGIR